MRVTELTTNCLDHFRSRDCKTTDSQVLEHQKAIDQFPNNIAFCQIMLLLKLLSRYKFYEIREKLVFNFLFTLNDELKKFEDLNYDNADE